MKVVFIQCIYQPTKQTTILTKRLRSTYHGYVQIAEIDATDATAPYVAKTCRWAPSDPVATRLLALALALWTREGTARETLYYAHDLRKNVVSHLRWQRPAPRILPIRPLRQHPPWKATWRKKIHSATPPNITTKTSTLPVTTTMFQPYQLMQRQKMHGAQLVPIIFLDKKIPMSTKTQNSIKSNHM